MFSLVATCFVCCPVKRATYIVMAKIKQKTNCKAIATLGIKIPFITQKINAIEKMANNASLIHVAMAGKIFF